MLWANRKLRLLVTGICNANCPHCNNEGIDHGDYPMPLGLVKVITSVAKASGELPASTTISGGEPLLHPKIEHLLALVAEVSNSITVSTNGFLLDARTATALASNGTTKVRIDLDPWRFDRPRDAQGSLNTARVADLASLVRDAGMDVAFNTVLTAYTPAQLSELLELCDRLGVTVKCFERLLRNATSHKHLPAPDVPFTELNSALTRFFGEATWLPDSVAINDRTATSSRFSIRYCCGLCAAGACFYSGLRCDPHGHLSTCINGFDSVCLTEGDSTGQAVEKIRLANLRGCCA